MARLRVSLLVGFLLALLGGTLLGVRLKQSTRQRVHLAEDLKAAAAAYSQGDVESIDLPAIAAFDWDTVYIFGPYTPPAQIDAALGHIWIGSRLTGIEASDAISLLVFTNRGHVVQYLRFPRADLDFSVVARDVGYTREEARFVADERNRVMWREDSSVSR